MFLLLYLFLLCKRLAEGVADLQAHGDSRVSAAGHLVGMVFLQHQTLYVVQRVALLLVAQQGIQAAVVVGSLYPAIGSCQIVVGGDAALGRLAEFGLLIVVIHLLRLVLLAHAVQGDGLVDVEASQLLVHIAGVGALALLILAQQLSELGNPVVGLLVFLSGVAGIDDVDQSGDGILVRSVGTVVFHVGQMLLVGTVEAVFRRLAVIAETSLTAADVDEQVDIVARRVAFHLLQFGSGRHGRFQGDRIVASQGQQVCQATGRLGIHVHISLSISVIYRGLPVEFRHTLLVQVVAGIAPPVVSRSSCQAPFLLQTVGQLHQLIVVPGFLCRFYELVRFLTLLLACLVPAARCEHCGHHRGEQPYFSLSHIYSNNGFLLQSYE